MLAVLEDKLWKAGLGQNYDETTWRKIVEALLADLRHFLSADFEVDSDLSIDQLASTFNIWIWSKTSLPSPVSVSWSAVLSGSPIGDPSSNDSFVVTVDLFLFHELGKKRLYSNDGLHFLRFAFTRSATEHGTWHFLGWKKDEWGEWVSLVFPE
jgi:hypothetical protein